MNNYFNKDFRQFRNFKRKEFILVACDTSQGAGDRSVAMFGSKNHRDTPLVWSSKASAVEMTNTIQPVLEKINDITGIKPLVCYERNNGGSFELERLARMNQFNKYVIFEMPDLTDPKKSTGKYGWDTNTATRPMMLEDAQYIINNQLWNIQDQATIEEFFSFIKKAMRPEAEKNSHDDHVMAFAILMQMVKYSPSIYDVTPAALMKEDRISNFEGVSKFVSPRAY